MCPLTGNTKSWTLGICVYKVYNLFLSLVTLLVIHQNKRSIRKFILSGFGGMHKVMLGGRRIGIAEFFLKKNA